VLIMLNPRAYFRRLEPRDRGRALVIALSAIAVVVLLVLLILHGR
jgi:hypothetical protein